MISRVAADRPRPRPVLPGPPAGPRPDPAACFAWCEAVVRAHHENFPVASFLLPARLRPHVCALYAFARFADDFADEPEYEGRRAQELDHWDDLLHRCFHGQAEHPVFVALSETIAAFDLPIEPMSNMLDAFRMDLAQRHYTTFSDLMAYVDRAARPIGRLVLYVFGVRDAASLRYGDELATALALTSFWQDLRRDLARDRVYVPQEDLRHFGVSERDLKDACARGPARPEIEALLRYETARTRAHFERARPLLASAPRELAAELGLFWYGGHRALDKIEARAGRLDGARVRLNTVDKALALARALTHQRR